MLHFPYTVTYFLQFCFGISIQLQRANRRLSCEEMKYGPVDTVIWVKQLFCFEYKAPMPPTVQQTVTDGPKSVCFLKDLIVRGSKE